MRYPIFTLKGAYSATATYYEYDIVTYQNNHYVAKTTTKNNAPSDSAYWSQMEDLGRVCMVACGSYSDSTTYKKLDVVRADDTFYIATQSGAGHVPSASSSYWMQMAATSSYRPTVNSSGILV